MGLIKDYMDVYRADIDQKIFITTAGEYERAIGSGKFKEPVIEDRILYPNGKLGFLSVRLRYEDNIAEIFKAERLERLKPVQQVLISSFGPIIARHSHQDIGTILSLFDNDPKTLLRGRELNPFVMEFHFQNLESFTKIDLNLFYSNSTVTISSKDSKGNWKIEQSKSQQTNKENPLASFQFAPAVQTQDIRIEVLYRDKVGLDANVHLYELIIETSRGRVRFPFR